MNYGINKMSRRWVVIIGFLFTAVCVSASVWSYSGSGAWTPPANQLGSALDFSSTIVTVPMDAVVQESPAQITLRFYSMADTDGGYDTDLSGTYRIYRKDPDALSWGAPVALVDITDQITAWTDTNVTVGIAYEYGLVKTNSIVIVNGNEWFTRCQGNIIAGIKVDRSVAKGHMAVVVTDDIVARLPGEYAQYKEDLTRDGWTIHEIITPRAGSYVANGTGPKDASGVPTGPFPTNHIHIRNQLIGLYGTYSNELKNVVLVGQVAVPRSGDGYVGPDGHGNRSACGADAYYADMDGVWTDVGSNTNRYSAEIATAVSLGKINIPGDGKFDADYMHEVTTPNSNLELGFGRIDFSSQVAAEYESTRNYFNKLHRYKTAAPDFRPGRRAMHRNYYGAITRAYLASIPGLLGMTNLDFIINADLPAVPSASFDADAEYSKINGPELFFFKGNTTPGYSHGSQAVFWTGLQSHWGYWFEPTVTSSQNTMQRRLAEDNFTLSYTWYIAVCEPNVNYLYHRLGMGGNAGDMLRVSMSNLYDPYNSPYTIAYTPMFMNHMGDSALRIFMFPPPTALQVLPGSGNPQLSWTAPADEPAVIGYHVYRSDSASGPFARLTSSPVAGTAYTDTSVSSGKWHYQVKAVRLETTGGGTFYNTSLAVQQNINLSGADPLLVSTNALPDANWDTAYSVQLTAQGGTPLYTWSAIDSLPAGLTLGTDGILSGKPGTNGTFAFTVQVTDAQAQTAQAQLSLDISALDIQSVEPEAGGYVQKNSTNYVARSYEPAMLISGGSYTYEGYLRFDLSDIHTNDALVQAKLVLTVDGLTPSGSLVEIQAALGADANDGWDENTLCYANRPGLNTLVAPAIATNLPVAHEKLEIDVTELVRNTLDADSAKKMTVRLFSDTATAWGKSAQICNRLACSLARPQLLVQTTGAEGYVPPPPSASFSANPVSGDAPLTVSFTDLSSGSITNRAWDFGDGSVLNTTDTLVEHVYTTAGTYTVQLAVSGTTGSSTNTQANLIQVSEPPPFDLFTAVANVADQQASILSSSVTLAWVGGGNSRVGDDGSGLPYVYIVPFELPAISAGTIASVTLNAYVESKVSWSTNPTYLDVVGLRVNASPTVLTTDASMTAGTVVGDNVQLVNSTVTTPVAVAYELDPAYFQAIYDNDPSAAGKFVFLLLRTDGVDPHVSNSYFNYTTQNGAVAANRPTLQIKVGSDVPPVPPPAPTAFMVTGGGQDVISWTTAQGSGYVYSVWYSTNLLGGFQPLETNLADSVTSITNVINATPVFYKINAQ